MMIDDIEILKKKVDHYKEVVRADKLFIDHIIEIADKMEVWCKVNGKKEPTSWLKLRSDAEDLLEDHRVLAVRYICDMTQPLPKGQTVLTGLKGVESNGRTG
jgi:hypothetical protein